MSWLTGYRRLTIRYERYSGNYLAFLGLAAALCCYTRFIRLTTWDTVKTVTHVAGRRQRTRAAVRATKDAK